MKKQVFLAAAATLAIGATEPTPPPAIPTSTPVIRFSQPPPCYKGCINPIEAVTFASYLGQRAGVAGDFEMTVRAVGEQNGRIFFNSETDYRDRNCLTVAMPAPIAQVVGGSSDVEQLRQSFVGKRIVVRGIAQRTRIDIIDDKGQRSGKYYFQVHIPMGSPAQMLVKP